MQPQLIVYEFLADSKGYLIDDDGFDYMKISFLRELKAQQRSLRCVCFILFYYIYLVIHVTKCYVQ